MQITAHAEAEQIELRLTGRIDATWADHLSSTIENAVRSGAHRVILNFEGVEYISSLGVRVLFLQYNQLRSVKGSLLITHASDFCRSILLTVGLGEILVTNGKAASVTKSESAPKQRRGGATYEVYPQPVTNPLTCTLVGHPERLTTTGFTADDCSSLKFASGSFGLGLGAFGQGYADCADRFGEFLAAGGCAITLPTNDRNALPDYVVEQGSLIPQVETLYALTGTGDFSTMVRFDAASDGPGKISLSELAGNLMEISSGQAIAFVILAETASLVGAALRKSPAGQPLMQNLPQVRDWLSFTTERSSDKSLCLLVGVASNATDANTAKFLRPLKSDSAISAHIHAAVFPYRPVQRGELPFGKTVADLLASSSPNTVLHLMADTRPFEGVGETDLSRGACWIGRLPVTLQG